MHFTDDDCDDSYLYYTSKVTAGKTHHLDIAMYITTDAYPCIVNI